MESIPPALRRLFDGVPQSVGDEVLQTEIRTKGDVHRSVAQCCRLVLERRAPVTVAPEQPELLKWTRIEGVQWPPEESEFEPIVGPSWLENEAIVDPFGRYFFSKLPEASEPFKNRSRIELYWRNIGVVAAELKVAVSDLTIVVLTHEVAHEFAHLGADLDGGRWLTARFSMVSTTAHEALAQHYCEEALRRMTDRHPGALDAFNRLLIIQPGVCSKRQRLNRKGAEGVRHRLLSIRNVEPVTSGAISQILFDD